MRRLYTEKVVKGWWISLFSAFVCCISYGLAQADDTKLSFSTGVRPPLVDGKNTKGFAEAVAKEAFRRVGVELDVVIYPSKLASINSSSGITDGELLRIEEYGVFYPELIRVGEPVMMMEFVAYSLNAMADVTQWSELSMRHVAYVNGWKVFENSVEANEKLIKTDDPVRLFQLLKDKRTEVVLYEKWQGLVLAKSVGMESVYVSGLPAKDTAMFMYLNKRHRELEPKVARALREMKEDGSYQRIYDGTLTVLLGSANKSGD